MAISESAFSSFLSPHQQPLLSQSAFFFGFNSSNKFSTNVAPAISFRFLMPRASSFPFPFPLPFSWSSSSSSSSSPSSRSPLYRRCPDSAAASPSFSETPTSSTSLSSSGSGPVKIVAVVGEGALSPLRGVPWENVMLHTAERLKWVDEGYEMHVYSDILFCSMVSHHPNLPEELDNIDIVLIVAINDSSSVKYVNNFSEGISNVVCLDSSTNLKSKLGCSYVHTNTKEGFFEKLSSSVKGTNPEKSVEVMKILSDSWARRNADDIRFCILVIINSYVRPVSSLKNLRAKGFDTLACMVKNCGSEVLNCLLDPNCRKALQCLNSCAPTDQVCSYQCIASHESPALEAFSLCVLQKHNCLGLTAEIPSRPYIPPLSLFRGDALSHEMAEDLFVGWLGRCQWSWRVVAGQNPAYDQFPCQYQLFYRGKARGSFWYEPVFLVKTLDGKMVWRRRRYRVKRSSVPGTFFSSVLDNGVVSKEFWTIVDVCAELSWGLFHYSGAAAAAGQSYSGAVLVSPDGKYPSSDLSKQKMFSALERCCIKDWELYDVDNRLCANPPLEIPDGSALHSMLNVNDLKTLVN